MQLTPSGGVYNSVPRFIKPNNAKLNMKTYPLILATLFVAFVCQSQPVPGAPVMQPPAMPRQYMPPPGAPPPGAAPAREPVNYLIRVEWKEPKSDPKSLEVLTTEGNFNLDTLQKNSVKINNNDIPTTLKFSGSIIALNDEKGRLQLFLGRTVPYVTGTSTGGMSSYSQMSAGLNSTFIVKFNKPMIIQTDENGEISVLVKRIED